MGQDPNGDKIPGGNVHPGGRSWDMARDFKPARRTGGAACCACDGPLTDGVQGGLPMANGEVVEKDYPGEWAGFDACGGCLEAYELGGITTLEVRLRAIKETGERANYFRAKLARIRRELGEFPE